ncbi:hypothetical protein HMSSN139_39660 [Paenibacillus sp. HMSSN-139]|nr:hypothetical protein HMSSN139_39660 [Paenibacillus sp. HMSSN-139]
MEQTLPSHANFKLSSILVPLLAIIAGVFMVVLDNTAMNVALSTLATDFGTDLKTLQWVVTGYMLAQASVIPLSGWLSDRFGAKTIFSAPSCCLPSVPCCARRRTGRNG